MSLFDKYGHLKEDSFEILINNTDSELERLEILEHLSDCDKCIFLYTEKLSNIELIELKEDISNTIIFKVKKKLKMIFINKYANAIIAACFTLLFWTNGVFTDLSSKTVQYIAQSYNNKQQFNCYKLNYNYENNIINFINNILNLNNNIRKDSNYGKK